MAPGKPPLAIEPAASSAADAGGFDQAGLGPAARVLDLDGGFVQRMSAKGFWPD